MTISFVACNSEIQIALHVTWQTNWLKKRLSHRNKDLHFVTYFVNRSLLYSLVHQLWSQLSHSTAHTRDIIHAFLYESMNFSNFYVTCTMKILFSFYAWNGHRKVKQPCAGRMHVCTHYMEDVNIVRKSLNDIKQITSVHMVISVVHLCFLTCVHKCVWDVHWQYFVSSARAYVCALYTEIKCSGHNVHGVAPYFCAWGHALSMCARGRAWELGYALQVQHSIP